MLLGLTYGLVAASLPTHASDAGKPPMTIVQFVKLCKQPYSVPSKPGAKTQTPAPQSAINDKIRRQCAQESAYMAGSAAAARRQRDRALHNLLLFSAPGLGIMTILSAGAGWVVAGRVLRPVRMITGTARRASRREPRRADRAGRCRRRAQGAGRHLRRHAGAARPRVRQPSAASSPTRRTSCERRSP